MLRHADAMPLLLAMSPRDATPLFLRLCRRRWRHYQPLLITPPRFSCRALIRRCYTVAVGYFHTFRLLFMIIAMLLSLRVSYDIAALRRRLRLMLRFYIFAAILCRCYAFMPRYAARFAADRHMFYATDAIALRFHVMAPRLRAMPFFAIMFYAADIACCFRYYYAS